MKIVFLWYLIPLLFLSLASAQDILPCKQGMPVHTHAKTMAGSGDSIDVLHYAIHLDILNLTQKEIRGYTEIRFIPDYSGMQIFTFDLEQLQVDSVLLNQQSVSFSYDNLILNIFSPSAYSPSDTLTAVIYYQGQPVLDPGGFGGFTFTQDTFFAYNLGVGMTVDPHNFGRCWYPCKDNFIERATYEFHIRVSQAKTAVCNGTLISDTDLLDGTHVLHWTLADPIPTYLSSVAVSNYIVHRDTIQANLGPVPVSLYVNPQDSLNAVNSFTRLDTTVKMFEQYFGPYRWERLGYVSVPFNGGAMEHATSIAYPRVTITGNDVYEWLYVHELAHAWFGNLVTCETAGDMWLNEGFSAWTEGFFYEKIYSLTDGRNYARQKHRRALQFGSVSDGGFFALSGVPHVITYGSTVYELGASTVQTLRHYIGDALFFPAITQYMQYYAFRHANSDSLKLFLEQSTGVNLTDFFDNWVYNPGVPHYKIDSFQAQVNGNGSYDVQVWLSQQRYGGSFVGNSNRVELHFFDATGNREIRILEFSGAQASPVTELPFAPVRVWMDPEEKCLDATTDELRTITSTGVTQFVQSFCNLNTQTLSDSAKIFVAHNWVAPDSLIEPGDIPVQFGRRYWKIEGDFPAGFSAKMTFTYDGRNTSTASNSTHFLDDAFITGSEEKLILMYRPGSGHYWKEVQGYTANMGNLNDKAGNMTVDQLLPGEYAFALKSDGNAIENVIASLQESFVVYPNPAENKVQVQFHIPPGQQGIIRIIDLQGRELRKSTLHDFQTTLHWDLSAYPKGIYSFCLEIPGREVMSRKLILGKD